MTFTQGSLRTPARAGAIAFLAAGATLFVQVLVHRMISAKLLNNYAFLVISLTMLGFALSGVALTRLLVPFLRDWSDALTLSAAGFVLSTLAVSVAFYRMGAGDQFIVTVEAFLRELLRWLPTALLFAIPFTFSGLMIGALLSDPDLPAARVYAFDLAGSALGALAVIPAIRHLGVEASTLLACALLLAGTVALAPPRRTVAFLQAGFSWRAVSQDLMVDSFAHTLEASGPGASFGGGVNVHITPAFAVSTSASWTVGDFTSYKFDNQEIVVDSSNTTSARFHIGVVWFPRGARVNRTP